MKIAPVADVEARFSKYLEEGEANFALKSSKAFVAPRKMPQIPPTTCQRRNPMGGFCGKAENVMTFSAYWQKKSRIPLEMPGGRARWGDRQIAGRG